MQGTVKWFDTKRGYGFILGDDGKEFFVHHSDIRMENFRYFNKGDIVCFNVVIGNDGRKRAIHVKPILTLSMVMHELEEKELHLMRVVNHEDRYGRIADDEGIYWNVVDKSNNLVIDKKMDLLGLVKYTGFEIVEQSA